MLCAKRKINSVHHPDRRDVLWHNKHFRAARTVKYHAKKEERTAKPFLL